MYTGTQEVGGRNGKDWEEEFKFPRTELLTSLHFSLRKYQMELPCICPALLFMTECEIMPSLFLLLCFFPRIEINGRMK